jgi:hypothetical protein
MRSEPIDVRSGDVAGYGKTLGFRQLADAKDHRHFLRCGVAGSTYALDFSERRRSMLMSGRLQCLECKTEMIVLAPRPLMHIFGDIRTYSCPTMGLHDAFDIPPPASSA